VERVTRDGKSDRPEWSPDGRRLVFSSGSVLPFSLWEQPADGSGTAVKLLDGTGVGIREGVYTPDGRSIVYRVDAQATNRDILRLPLVGDRTPVPLIVGPTDDKVPRVSPHGQWLAYVSNESGREEVYVRPLAPGGGRVAVSSSGGGEPLWCTERPLRRTVRNRRLPSELRPVPRWFRLCHKVKSSGRSCNCFLPRSTACPSGFTWRQRLHAIVIGVDLVFLSYVDLLACPTCHGTMQILACITTRASRPRAAGDRPHNSTTPVQFLFRTYSVPALPFARDDASYFPSRDGLSYRRTLPCRLGCVTWSPPDAPAGGFPISAFITLSTHGVMCHA